jgi:hypothetical protein
MLELTSTESDATIHYAWGGDDPEPGEVGTILWTDDVLIPIDVATPGARFLYGPWCLPVTEGVPEMVSQNPMHALPVQPACLMAAISSSYI